MMDTLSHHGVSCRLSTGRSQRHTALNDVVKHALHGAGIPSVLEPLDLYRRESIHPDGLSIVPYNNKRSLTWDCTSIDTFAKFHVNNTAITVGVVATDAENMKCKKYASLNQSYMFELSSSKQRGSMANQCPASSTTLVEGSQQLLVIVDN